MSDAELIENHRAYIASLKEELEAALLKIKRLTAWKDALMKELTVEQLQKADSASLRVRAPSNVSAGE